MRSNISKIMLYVSLLIIALPFILVPFVDGAYYSMKTSVLPVYRETDFTILTIFAGGSLLALSRVIFLSDSDTKKYFKIVKYRTYALYFYITAAVLAQIVFIYILLFDFTEITLGISAICTILTLSAGMYYDQDEKTMK